MSEALQNSGRPIVFNVCEWGSNQPWLWAPAIANLWRTTDDIQDCWNCTQDWGGMGWPTILDKQVGLEKYAGPGHWNDPDMLEVGNGGMTGTEYQAHFSLWCILAAPLMAGNDLRSMTAEIKNILTNKEVIALDQDPLGIQGSKIRDDGDFEVWLKPLQGGDVGVCFLNRSAAPKDFRIEWKDLSINGKFKIKDLWNKKSVEDLSATFSSKVDSHGVILLRLMKEK
jgi:alpha-galactosidase